MISCPDCQMENAYSQLQCEGCGRSLANVLSGDQSDPFLGKRLAREFILRRNLGSGEIGIVYEAVNEAGTRRVAIKVLHDDVAESFGADLLRWAKRAAQLRHKKVARILGANRIEDGPTFIVTEFVEGETLMALLKRNGPLDPAHAADILFQLCSALAPIHKAGRPHANLKPENVFMTSGDDGSDYVKIVDVGSPVVFGAHHLSGERQVVGAPKYFSPEQASGESVGLASDQFTLGVIGYLLLTGALPFFGATPDQLLTAIMTTDPKRVTERSPQVPAVLADIIHRCLSKAPEDRYPDLRTMAADFAKVIKLARRNELAPNDDDSVDGSLDGSLGEADRTVLFTVPQEILNAPDPTAGGGGSAASIPQDVETLEAPGPVPLQQTSQASSAEENDDLAAAMMAAEAELDGPEPAPSVVPSPPAPEPPSSPVNAPQPAALVSPPAPPEQDQTEAEDISAAMSAALDALGGGDSVASGPGSLNLDDAFAEVSDSLDGASDDGKASFLGDDLISDIDEAISITQSGRRPTDIGAEPAAPVATLADFGEVSTMSDSDKKSRLMARALATVRPENLSRPWVLAFLFCLLVIAAMTAQIINQNSEAEEQAVERKNLHKRLQQRAAQEAARKKRKNVLLVTTPPGAGVYLGSVMQGRTPMNVALQPGKPINYSIKLEGYEAVSHTIDPAAHPGGGITLEQRIALTALPTPVDAGVNAATAAQKEKATAKPSEQKTQLKAAKVVTRVIEKTDGKASGDAKATKQTKGSTKVGAGVKKRSKPKKKKPSVKRRRPSKKKKKKAADDLGANPFD